MSALVTMGIFAPSHGARERESLVEVGEDGVHPRMTIEMAEHQQDVKDSEADAKEIASKMALGKQMTTKRAKGKSAPAVIKKWIRIEPNGESSVLTADKYKLTTKLGIQTRDLRLLDPHFTATYPSCILCRDKSIVVHLEHIKAIITTNFMMVVNPEEEMTTKFIEVLKERLAAASAGGQGGSRAHAGSTQDLQKAAAGTSANNLPAAAAGNAVTPPRFDMDLPFELRVLEICLDELANEFDTATSELEAIAYPSLDSLASKVTSPRLERVRRLKNRLVRLTTRVETVREVLEKFLDDDEDMHDLNLTANEDADAEEGTKEGEVAVEPSGAREKEPDLSRTGRDPRYPHEHSMDSSLLESEVAEVEMLLEAYFMHYDNSYNRLKTLSEYIKDTEDLVNIKLDQHRNQLITTDLILTALTCAMAIITTISGIFGMNLDSGLQEAPNVFNEVTIATSLGALMLFGGFLIFAWRRGLLSWS